MLLSLKMAAALLVWNHITLPEAWWLPGLCTNLRIPLKAISITDLSFINKLLRDTHTSWGKTRKPKISCICILGISRLHDSWPNLSELLHRKLQSLGTRLEHTFTFFNISRPWISIPHVFCCLPALSVHFAGSEGKGNHSVDVARQPTAVITKYPVLYFSKPRGPSSWKPGCLGQKTSFPILEVKQLLGAAWRWREAVLHVLKRIPCIIKIPF